jgi:c-di-GMP-binding flagellar brake protein YcgR
MTDDSPTSSDHPAQAVQQMPLKAMRLRAGMALQTKRLVAGSVKRESQFLAAMEGKGVMVGPQGPDGEQTGLVDGEICVVRGFTGQYEFSFLSKVLQTFEKPFPYALLAYPKHVDARLVRRSLRTKAAWPTRVWQPDAVGADPSPRHDAQLLDISLSGAMVHAPVSPAIVGQAVQLSVTADLDGDAQQLQVAAVVCHSSAAPAGDGFHIGVAFTDLTAQDKLVLHLLTQPPAPRVEG